MKESTLSRRVSELIGVALFMASVFWIVSLASYDPGDPAFFLPDVDAAFAHEPARVAALEQTAYERGRANLRRGCGTKMALERGKCVTLSMVPWGGGIKQLTLRDNGKKPGQ